MTAPISAVTAITGPSATTSIQPAARPGEFQNLLQGTIDKLNGAQADASKAIQAFLTGENDELHTTVLAAEKAAIMLDLGLQVRNKVVAAYQEIMRMQL